jgi:CubicO group peptidase (beta-lactamase class C family)
MSLLGHVLELKAGASFDALVAERICQPLGMKSTGNRFPPWLETADGDGHDEKGAFCQLFLRSFKSWPGRAPCARLLMIC